MKRFFSVFGIVLYIAVALICTVMFAVHVCRAYILRGDDYASPEPAELSAPAPSPDDLAPLFTFTADSSLDNMPADSGKICNIDIDDALVYGKLKTLFGEPLYESEDIEEQYIYCLTAAAPAGNQVCIFAYSGASGPAIGGSNDLVSEDAARALVALLKSATPADYSYIGYYCDTNSKISMGVTDGVPYFTEEYCPDIPLNEYSPSVPNAEPLPA